MHFRFWQTLEETSPGTRAAPAYISTATLLTGPGEGPELQRSCLTWSTSSTRHYPFLSVCPEPRSSFIISKTAAKMSGVAPRFHFSSFNCAPSHGMDQQANNNKQKRNQELVSRPGWGDLLLESWSRARSTWWWDLLREVGEVLFFS